MASPFPLLHAGTCPMTLCSCEIRADADGVRGVPVVGITVVVDIAEIRRRLDGPYRGHPIFLVFQMLQETVVRLPQCLDHVEQGLDFQHDVHILVLICRQRLGDVLELVLELVAALQRLV